MRKRNLIFNPLFNPILCHLEPFQRGRAYSTVICDIYELIRVDLNGTIQTGSKILWNERRPGRHVNVQ